MVARTKRRHISYYLSLPLVVAIVFALVAKLVAWQRADLVAELAERVAHSDAPEASAAVRLLASMPRPPVAILVRAAASADREVAQEAQQTISKLLRRWQRQIEDQGRTKAVARQLSELAELFAQHAETLSRADEAWLTKTTRKVLRLANRIPSQHAPLVAGHCDAILAAISPGPASIEKTIRTELAGEKMLVSAGALTDDDPQMRPTRLQREFSVGATPTPVTAKVRDNLQGSERIADKKSADTSAEGATRAPWQADWSHPLFRIAPAMPINGLPRQERSHDPAPLPSGIETKPIEAEANDRPLAHVDSRELLNDWLRAEGADVFPIEQELTRRGFGRLTERLVEQFFSRVPQDRLRMVDDVLTEPGVDARPWLVLLADDEDADVRLLAVTIMATSSDAALIEKAWDVAINDRDPRIAGLAGRLRERRDATLRR